MSVTPITAEEVNERINQGEKVTFVDTRLRGELPSHEARLPRAVHAPVDEADQHLRDVSRDHLAVTYGEDENESSAVEVAELMDERGFKEVHPLEGGLKAWREKGLPIERH
jgi:rhodanese-related sulfurtransferase